MSDSSPKTPPPGASKPTQQPDTLSVNRSTSQYEYLSGNLKTGREAVLSDLQRVLAVPFDRLRKRIVQDNSLDKGRIAQIRACLEEKKLIVSNKHGTHWKEFKTSPASSKESESKTFAFLTPIINFILRQQSSCVVDYFDNPNSTPFSSRNNTSRPDGYIRLLSTTTVGSTETNGSTRHHWFDIAVPFEFKLKNGPNDALDDEHKIIWSLHNIMREDPCRRFAYGITIEDVNVKLWLTNRACLVVTEPINFMEDIDDFIFLFSALGSATDVALGWDPTIERILDTENKNPTQYRITVNQSMYTTTSELATYGADSLVGRGTRVYKAKDAEGNVVAIKDSWKDSDRLAEGAIIAEILQAIRDKFPTEADEATRYFVSVKEFGDVIVGDSNDCTMAITDDAEGGALPEGCQWREVNATIPLAANLHIRSVGHVPGAEIQTLSPATRGNRHLNSPIPRKVHHRTVFNDVGTALQDLLKLEDVTACLRDTLKALYYMHNVGWIHRDYSVKNALQVVKDGQSIGKLSDFEYAKSTTSETSHDVRTGTMDFMAWEVDQFSYQFLPEHELPAPKRLDDMQVTPPIAPPSPPFRMNFLHDLESVFWATLWVVLFNTDKLNPTTDLEGQYQAYNNAFPGQLGLATRLVFLTKPSVINKALDTLSPSCYNAALPLYTFAKDLVAAYQRAEAPYPNIHIPDDDITVIHNKVREHLDVSWKDSVEVDLIRVHTLYEQSHKRPIAEAETSPTKPPLKKMR